MAHTKVLIFLVIVLLATSLIVPYPSGKTFTPDFVANPDEYSMFIDENSSQSTTMEIVPPNDSTLSAPSNTIFVIALVCGVCGVIAIIVGTGVAGYCLLFSQRAREARARRELRNDFASGERSYGPDSAATTESMFNSSGSGANSVSRLASGTNSTFEAEPVAKNIGGKGAGTSVGDSEYRANADSIPMGERGASISGRKSRTGNGGNGISLAVTKAESSV